MLVYSEYLKMLIGLIAIINPIGTIPIFISLTAGFSMSEKKKATNIVTSAVLVILLVTLICGELMLEFFGISINSFRVAGGLLILLTAIAMMHAKTSGTKQTPEELEDVEQKESVAIIPLAIPLLAGPGAISTIILYAHKGTDIGHYFAIGLIILVVAFCVFAVFAITPYISKYISKTGINVFTRIMGLILAAISIEFMANGLKGLFPSLA